MRAGWTDNRGSLRPAGGTRRRRGLARRVVVVVSLATVSLVFIIAVLCAVLVGWTPGWWRTIDANDPAVAAAGADLENAVASELSRVRPGAAAGSPASARGWRSDEWTVEIGVDEANAWLNTRMRKWLTNRGASMPDEVRQIEVAFAAGEVRIGAVVAAGDSARVVSALGRPFVDEDGGLWVRGTRLFAGRLRLPISWIAAGQGPEWLSGELRKAPGFAATLDALAGKAPLAAAPVIALGDGRVVRVVGIKAAPGLLLVTCRTEATP